MEVTNLAERVETRKWEGKVEARGVAAMGVMMRMGVVRNGTLTGVAGTAVKALAGVGEHELEE